MISNIWTKDRGRGDQTPHQSVFAGRTQAGTLGRENLDYACQNAEGKISQLPYLDQPREHLPPEKETACERQSRAKNASGRASQEMPSLHEKRETSPSLRTHPRDSLQYRRTIPSGVPGTRGILPTRRQPAPHDSSQVGHGSRAHQNTGTQVPDHGPAGLQAISSHSQDGQAILQGTASHRPTRREKPTGSGMGRHPTQEKTPGTTSRSTTTRLEQSDRTGTTAACRYVRTVWVT